MNDDNRTCANYANKNECNNKVNLNAMALKMKTELCKYPVMKDVYYVYAKLFNKQYYERCEAWYKHDNKKKYPVYYICRFDNKMGIGATANILLLAWEWIKQKGMIPLVLMGQGYQSATVWNGELLKEVYKNNIWEQLFETPITIEDALKKENVYLSHMNCNFGKWKIPCDLKEYVDPSRVNKIRSITDPKDFHLYYKYGNEFFKPKKELMEEADKIYQSFGDGKILGVGMREEFSLIRELRGTAGYRYLEDTLSHHPIVPTVAESIKIVEQFMKETGCNRIYLSTMFSDVIEKFQEKFGTKAVVFCERERCVFEDFKKNPDSFIASFEGDNEENKNLLLEKGYIIDSLLLTKCNSIIMAPSGQIKVVGMLKKDEFENMVFFENYNKKFPFY